MYLKTLKLWNFRKFGSEKDDLDLAEPDLEVPFTKGVNVLIGENDSGKTAIIDAIKLVLDTHSSEWIKLVHEDFCKKTSRLRIECRFENLSDGEAKNFTEWLGMEGEGGDAKPYLKVILDASKKGNERLHYDIRAGADDEGDRLPAQARDYLRTTYLKPLRDAKAELIPRRNSRLSQILSGHEGFKRDDEDHVLEKVSRCLNCLFQKYFKQDYKSDSCVRTEGCPFEEEFYGGSGTHEATGEAGREIRDVIQNMLNEFLGATEYTATFGVIDRELRNILEQFKLSLSDEELGLGSQNLLFIAAELLNLRRKNWTGLRLGLIEELEAHLHPQGQMRVIEYFQKMGSKEAGDKTKDESGANTKAGNEDSTGEDIQLILTTHSPNLGSKVKLENLIICHDGQAFPMGAQYTELVDTDYSFLERFLDVTKANLFFARGVIMVEGWAEELMLPVLARKIGMDLTEKGVSIVNVGGTAFLRYAKIFRRRDTRRMDIPVAVVTDLDVKPGEEDNKENGKAKKDAQKEKKEKKYDGQKVKTFVAPHWTLEYCIALSKELAPYLFEAIKAGVEEMREDGKSIASITGGYAQFSPEKAQEEVALEMLDQLILKKEISKTIIAQHFAAILEKENITEQILDKKDTTKYLVDAIRYVTS
jgi:putative ATP-dependent endonuclease of OLD family